MTGYRNRLAGLCGAAASLVLAAGAADAGTISLWDGTGSNDSTVWSALGADGAAIASPFSATSADGVAITGSLAGGVGLVAVQCPAGSCSWTGGFPAGDSLVWAFDSANAVGTAPLTLEFGTPVLAGGLEIQADVPGAFFATVEAFAGATPLGGGGLSSDGAGDPVFVGLQDTDAEITSLVFDLSACGNADAGCDVHDFAADTLLSKNPSTPPPPAPEPASALLLLSALAGTTAMGLARRRTSRKDAV